MKLKLFHLDEKNKKNNSKNKSALKYNEKIRRSGFHVVFKAPENSKTERGRIEFCRSRKIISVECLRRDWQLVGS